MTYNIRSPSIPDNSIVLDITSNVVPFGYSHESSLFDKYPKGIPNLCTQPGGTLGAHTHTEVSNSTSHTHTGPNPHNHGSVTSGTPSCAANQVACGSGNSGCHTHNWTPACTAIAITIGSDNGVHTHDSQPLEPSNQTVRFLKKTSSSIRANNVPICKVVWYSKTIASVPANYSIETGLTNNRFFKGVPNACTAPGTQVGSNCHTHSNTVTTHTHTSSIASHTHTKPSCSGAGSTNTKSSGASAANVPLNTHTHSTSPITVGSTALCGTTSVDTVHAHTGLSHLPLHRELLPIKTTTISLRNKRLPIGGILLWLCNLTKIPTGYQVANGTNGTVCTLDRHARAVPNACTSPGTGAGTASHQHAAQTHTHASPGAHTHTITGGLAAGTSSVTYLFSAGFFSPNLAHTHTSPANTSCMAGGATSSSGSHQHTTTNNDPASVRVAYIERIA